MSYRSIYHDDKEGIVSLFVGKSVKKVNEFTLELSDGTVLEVEGNYGCGGCSAGNYYLEELNECENIITNVELVETDDVDCDVWDCKTRYEVFVLAGDRRINLLRVEGDDGNGYYGTGYWIKVRKP